MGLFLFALPRAHPCAMSSSAWSGKSRRFSERLDWEIRLTKLVVISTHPDKDTLCKSKRQEGL
jgi:hypothetical protein